MRSTLAALGVLLVSTTAEAATPLGQTYVSPDVSVVLGGTTVGPLEVASDAPSPALVDLGVLPAGANVVAYHRSPDGQHLFALDIAANLGGVAVTPRDIIGYDGASYTIELNGAERGIPAGAAIDAIAGLDEDLLVSFDVTIAFEGIVVEDEDLVRIGGVSSSLFFDGSAAGVPAGLDLDATHRLSNGHLLLSFDVAGQVSGISANHADVLEYTPGAGTWELAVDVGARQGWGAADLDAFLAEEPATPTPSATATVPFTATALPSSTATALPSSTIVPPATHTATAIFTATVTASHSATSTRTAETSATPTATPIASATGIDTTTPTGTPTIPDVASPTTTTGPGFAAGDSNCDGRVNAADLPKLIDVVSQQASQCGSDANCDDVTDAADVEATIELFFSGAPPAPCAP